MKLWRYIPHQALQYSHAPYTSRFPSDPSSLFMPRNEGTFAAIPMLEFLLSNLLGAKKPASSFLSWDSVSSRGLIFGAACRLGSLSPCRVLRAPDWVTLMLPCGAGWHDTWLH
jgi:hypothetical protein